MKTRLFALLLMAILAVAAITGCQASGAGGTMKPTAASGRPTDTALSSEEAQNIALKHAGFTADQVTALHTKYEVDSGIPRYDVEFYHEFIEYDYEIHADTGEILSFSKDN